MSVHVLRLLLVGLTAGAAVAGLERFVGRRPFGPLVIPTAVLFGVAASGQELVGRFDGRSVALAVLAAILGVTGAVQLTPDPGPRVLWTVLGGLVSLVGVWAAVPENSHVIVAAGATVGVVVVAIATGVPLRPANAGSLAVVVAWSAWAGAGPRVLALAGGLLGLGLAVAWPVGQGLLRKGLRRRSGIAPGAWLLVAHCLLAATAARWVGSAADATWARVAVLVLIGVAVAAATRPALAAP